MRDTNSDREESGRNGLICDASGQAFLYQRLDLGVDVRGFDKKRRVEAMEGEFLRLGDVVPRYLDAELRCGSAVAGEVDSSDLGFFNQL